MYSCENYSKASYMSTALAHCTCHHAHYTDRATRPTRTHRWTNGAGRDWGRGRCFNQVILQSVGLLCSKIYSPWHSHGALVGLGCGTLEGLQHEWRGGAVMSECNEFVTDDVCLKQHGGDAPKHTTPRRWAREA
jgi:hypothetical protein